MCGQFILRASLSYDGEAFMLYAPRKKAIILDFCGSSSNQNVTQMIDSG